MQLLNAFASILVAVGKLILVKVLHSANAPSPMLVTAGKSILSNDLHSKNAKFSIFLIVLDLNSIMYFFSPSFKKRESISVFPLSSKFFIFASIDLLTFSSLFSILFLLLPSFFSTSAFTSIPVTSAKSPQPRNALSTLVPGLSGDMIWFQRRDRKSVV